MTYRAAIDEAVTSLEPTDTPFLDALVLLAFATDDTKEHVLASMNNEVPDQCIET